MAFPISVETLLNKERIESSRIEFKKGWNPDKIYRSICAFANDFDNIGGGYILVGVEEEDGKAIRPVKGLSETEMDTIQKEMVNFNNLIQPYYAPKLSDEIVDGKHVLAIWVPSGVERPYKVPDNITAKAKIYNYYIRYGTSNVVPKGEQKQELEELGNLIPFDERPNQQATLDDVSLILVRDYLSKIKSKISATAHTMSMEDLLSNMNLLTGPKEWQHIKNVALMMFTEDPSKFFPYTQVDVVIFPEGKIKNPNNFTETTFKGPVPTLIRQTLQYLQANVIKEYVVKQKDQPESIRYYNYPMQALEEAVTNSLYHRDYRSYEPVEVTVEPDRISILSFSGPDRSISMEAIRKGENLRCRRYRNRRLGDFLKELDLTEGRSTGIPTIQDELIKNGSAAATIETDESRSFFLIDIPCRKVLETEELVEQLNVDINDPKSDPNINQANKQIDNESKRAGSTGDPGNQPIDPKLDPKLIQSLKELLKRHPKLSRAALSSELNVSERQVRYILDDLKAKGILAREGGKTNGKWIILK